MFIAAAAIFPRLTLLICWFAASLPANTTDFWVDVGCAIFCPRCLVA